MKTSGAQQIHDLARALVDAGHTVSIILSNEDQLSPVIVEARDLCELILVKAHKTKDIGYIKRAFFEFINPYTMWNKLKHEPLLMNQKVDGVIWYSPSIFWGPLIKSIKDKFRCKSYLILRDIFPDWAVDLGIIRKGPSYLFLKIIERYQYAQADKIGIQSPNNLDYFQKKYPNNCIKLEVLWNWLGRLPNKTCSIRISDTPLAGRKIFVYAGNMGKAQSIEVLLRLAHSMRNISDIGFLLVGRGSELPYLRKSVSDTGLDNLLILDEISGDELCDLYAQSHVGIVSLNTRHRTHNIPGKFLSYIQCGLPILAIINDGNDLIEMIKSHHLGEVCTQNSDLEMNIAVNKILENLKNGFDYQSSCQHLSEELFSPTRAATQIVKSLHEDHN